MKALLRIALVVFLAVGAIMMAMMLVNDQAAPVVAQGRVEAPSAALDLTILHTNDMHGRVDEYHRDGSFCKTVDDVNCIGGFARMSTLVQQVRGTEPNVLLVDAGDQSQGTLYYTMFKSTIVYTLMNELGYDAMAIGNHEFDDGPDELAYLIDHANFPLVGANINAAAEPLLAGKIVPSTIVTFSGEPVGVIGLTTPEAPELSSPGDNVVFNDPAASLQAEIDRLSGLGVNKIIALTHLGYDVDLQLAGAVTGVDVIVGGHSHTFVYTPTAPITFTNPQYPNFPPIIPSGPYPTVAQDAGGNPVLVVSDYQWGAFMGQLNVSFDTNGVVTAYDGNPVYLGSAFAKDPAIQTIISDTYRGDVLELMNTPVGTTTVDLLIDVGGQKICRAGECLLGNLVADAMLWQVNSIDPNDQYQIAVQNGGGLRAPITADSVTVGEVMEVLPFGNSIATFSITGARLVEALENGVGNYPGQGRFPQVSGMRYTWSPSLPAGSRIVKVEVLSGTEYVRLDPKATYKVVTNDFMRRGGDGYTAFRDYAINPYDFGALLDQVVRDYIEAHSPITLQIEGRIVKLDKVISILHTNDTHGYWPEFYYKGTTPEMMEAIATLIKQEKAKNPNTLLLDAGDSFQGNAFAQYFRNANPNPIAGGFNLLGYDAFTIGNHEFNFGPATFASMLGQLNMPILAANLSDDGRYGFINDHVKDYITKTVDGIDITIFGLTNPRVPRYELPSNIPGLTFESATATAKSLVPALIATENPDLLVGLTHIGFDPYAGEPDSDSLVAQEVAGIDVLVGAHSHTKLDPAVVVTSTVNPTGTLIAQTLAYAQYLGKVNIGFTGNMTDGYQIAFRDGYLLGLTGVATDTQIHDYLAPFVAQLANYTSQEIGQTTVPISATEAYTRETNGANLQADAAVWQLEDAGVDVDFHLSGAMSNRKAADSASEAAPFNLTVNDMYTLMPYENSLMVLRMNGPQLKTILERAYYVYYNYKYVPNHGGLSYYTTCMLDTNAGSQISYKEGLPNGNNVLGLTFGGTSVDFNDADIYYNVSTVNYLAAGSCNFNIEGETMWPLDQIITDTQFYVRDSVIGYITELGIISPTVEGRLQFHTLDHMIQLPLIMKDYVPAE